MAARTARPIKFKVDITVKFRSKTYTLPKDREVTVTKSVMEIDVSLSDPAVVQCVAPGFASSASEVGPLRLGESPRRTPRQRAEHSVIPAVAAFAASGGG